MNTKTALEIAYDNYVTALADWSAKQLAGMLLVGTADDDGLQEAFVEMRCAAAILWWELNKGWKAAEQLGAHYDDDTVKALLLGAQG